jgi:hypothetical protein
MLLPVLLIRESKVMGGNTSKVARASQPASQPTFNHPFQGLQTGAAGSITGAPADGMVGGFGGMGSAFNKIHLFNLKFYNISMKIKCF